MRPLVLFAEEHDFSFNEYVPKTYQPDESDSKRTQDVSSPAAAAATGTRGKGPETPPSTAPAADPEAEEPAAADSSKAKSAADEAALEAEREADREAEEEEREEEEEYEEEIAEEQAVSGGRWCYAGTIYKAYGTGRTSSCCSSGIIVCLESGCALAVLWLSSPCRNGHRGHRMLHHCVTCRFPC